jgi:hypothetical protein
MKKWLAIIPDGKLPTNQSLKDKKKTISLVYRLRVLICQLLQKSSALFARVIKSLKVIGLDINMTGRNENCVLIVFGKHDV